MDDAQTTSIFRWAPQLQRILTWVRGGRFETGVTAVSPHCLHGHLEGWIQHTEEGGDHAGENKGVSSKVPARLQKETLLNDKKLKR